MKNTRFLTLSLSVLVLSLFVEKSFAEEEIVCRAYKTWPGKEDAFQPCYYVGVGMGMGFGFTSLEFDADDSKLKPKTGNTSWTAIDDNDQGFKFFSGYHFAPSWFVEGVVADLGHVELKNAHPFITKTETIHYQSTSLFGGYYLPVEKWVYHDWPIKLFVKAGVSYLTSEASSKLVKLEHTKVTQFSTGAGLEWQINRQWMLRGEVETVSVDTQLSTLSLAYWFGGKKHYYEIDKVVIPEPIPEPVVIVQPENTTTLVMLDAQRLDVDKDGVPDELDACNNTPPGLEVNAKGCAVYQGALEGVQVEVNSTQLTASSKGALEMIVTILRKAPDTRIEIQAHTDSDGSDDFNMKLSMRRAETVRNYLISKGIAEKRLDIKGFGESRPIDTNDTEEGKKNNRRVDFKIVE